MFVRALLSAAFIEPMLASGSSATLAPREWVVLVHGMGRTSISMKRIEWTLRKAGYHVVNVTYPSRRFSIEMLADDALAKTIRTRVPHDATRVDFVTHSLGGIVLRQYLATHGMTNLGRVVMLAPPNHGSQVADALKRSRIGRWILGPAGRELGSSPSDRPERLPPVDYALGVIAGDRSSDPWFAGLLPRPNDGKVTVQNTRVSGMSDFIVLHYSHTWMMWHRRTIAEALAFLQTGHFIEI
jgi:alpha-beta hydrolase superfamily lysophospholipase